MRSNRWIIAWLAAVALALSLTAQAVAAPRKVLVRNDFDGDGSSDLALWDPETGRWRFATDCDHNPDTGCGFSHGHLTGTREAAIAVPADYNGDGSSDPAYFDPAGGQWQVVPLAGPQATIQLGVATDIPVPADYDGDGAADPAVFRPADGTWHRVSGLMAQFGQAGDRPVPGDYDGDRIADLAVFRPPNGTWIVRRSSDAAVVYQAWGMNGDVPVPGDYDGDGIWDAAVIRPLNGQASQWWIQRSRDGAQMVTLGSFGDLPVPADYDGDGAIEPAVYRRPPPHVGPEGRGTWLIAGRPEPIGFGEPGEEPV